MHRYLPLFIIIYSLFMNTIKSLLALLLCAACTWLALWAANVVNYLFSLPISFSDAIIEELVESKIIKFIYVFITTGIAYFVTFFYLFKIAFNQSYVIWDSPILGRICLGLIILSVIIICDVRIHSYLPYFCVNIVEYIQTEWNYIILSPVNWSDLDFSGKNISDMQYTVFDVAVAISGLIVLIDDLDD